MLLLTDFFVFCPPFLKIFTDLPLELSFQNLDPQLTAVVIDAEITRLGAKVVG
jgi:hypothetical protein